MTSSSLSSNPLGYVGIDYYQNPPTILAGRAPTINDIYNKGSEWIDQSVSPNVIYQTVGAGVWNSSSTAAPGVFTTISASGLASLNGSATIVTGSTALNLGADAGTGAINVGTGAAARLIVIGNQTGVSSTTIQAGSGGVQLAGNVFLKDVATKLTYNGGAVTDFIGSSTLVSGTVTIANTNIASTDRIFFTLTAANASTALGTMSYSISAGTSFTVTSLNNGTPGSTQTGDLRSFIYVIIGQN